MFLGGYTLFTKIIFCDDCKASAYFNQELSLGHCSATDLWKHAKQNGWGGPGHLCPSCLPGHGILYAEKRLAVAQLELEAAREKAGQSVV